jgi:hypothetical protein
MKLTTEQLTRLADEAYGTAVSTSSVAERAYAAGIEDLSNFLTGKRPATVALQMLLDEAQRQASYGKMFAR